MQPLPDTESATPAPNGYVPYVPPPSTAPRRDIVALGLADPLRWLAAGGRDLLAAKGLALFYGLCFWMMAVVLAAVFQHQPEYTMSIVSGCFLVGPFLAMGLYEVSRRREAGLVPELGASITCWDAHIRSMAMLVLVLMVLELLWGRASLVVFAVFFKTGMPSTASVLQAVFSPDNWQFLATYLVVGSVFAGLVYAFCVVSIPMVLDRDTDAITAAITSFQVVTSNPLTMLFWGVLIIALLLGAMLLPWSVGLLAVGPWLGHASWHAYRRAVRWAEPGAAGN